MSTRSLRGELISAGMAAARERGRVLGRPKDKDAARAFALSLAPVIQQLQMQGRGSLKSLADGLTERGIRTSTGKIAWEPNQLAKILCLLNSESTWTQLNVAHSPHPDATRSKTGMRSEEAI